MLDQAINALKSYDWGTEPKVLAPIDDAIVKTHGDHAARAKLEAGLLAVLAADVSRCAKDFVCRKLRVIGTAASVGALAKLLADKDLSHMARYALERIPAPEAAAAMRDALPKLSGNLKVGVIGSLGVRQDAACVPALGQLLGDTNAAVARAAAYALGDMRTAEAAEALAGAKGNEPAVRQATTDARLTCAEGLLAAGKKSEALAVYKSYAGSDQPKHIRLAATRGMLACAGK
jgi:HEAT repeat protein